MNHASAYPGWDAIYLTCFGVGLALSVLAFAGGFFQLHVGHLKTGAPSHSGGHSNRTSPVNGFTAVAFLCWFGGAGYLLMHGHVFMWALALGLSILSGLAGAGLVFWFFASVLLPRERILEPADTPIIGVLGRVSAPVLPGGVGEMLYSQGGARRSMPIAAEDGAAIARHAEVVVLRYARGIAYVRRWDEMQQILLGDAPAAQSTDLSGE